MSDMYSDDRMFGSAYKGPHSRIVVLINEDEGDTLVELWEVEGGTPVPRRHKVMEFEPITARYLAMVLGAVEDG